LDNILLQSVVFFPFEMVSGAKNKLRAWTTPTTETAGPSFVGFFFWTPSTIVIRMLKIGTTAVPTRREKKRKKRRKDGRRLPEGGR
jgi:hypothetical protein